MSGNDLSRTHLIHYRTQPSPQHSLGRSSTSRFETTFGPISDAVTTVSIDQLSLNSEFSSNRNSAGSFSSFEPVAVQIPVQKSLTRSDSFNYFQSKSSSTSTLSSSHTNRLPVQQQVNQQPSRVETARKVNFVDTPPDQLFCKICKQVFTDPFIMSCGHSFCKKCTMTTTHCPVHKVRMSTILPNLALSDQIGDLLVYCRYCKFTSNKEIDTSACTEKIKYSQLKTHESTCMYAPVKCPNNPNCPEMLRKNLEEHLKNCNNCTCQYKKYGCKFIGDANQMTVHMNNCKYAMMKDFLNMFENKINQLQVDIRNKDEDNNYLRSLLNKANEKLEDTESRFNMKIEMLNLNQSKLQDEIISFKQQHELMNNQLQELNTRLRMTGVGVFDPQQIFKCKGTFVGHSGPVWCLCAYNDYLFSGSSDKVIKVWDTATNYRCLKTLEGHKGIILALTTHENKLYSGSSDCCIKIWSISTFEEISTTTAHENAVCTLVCSGNKLFSGSLKSIKVWTIKNDSIELIKELEGLNHWVRALVAHQGFIYSGSYQTIKIWDVSTLECTRVLSTNEGSVYSIAVTNHHIICGTYEKSINVWKQGTYEPLHKLVGHSGIIYALTVISTPEQTKVFSASYDKSIRVWSMENMICTQTLIRHEGSVVSLAACRGRVFSGGVDFCVKVWQ